MKVLITGVTSFLGIHTAERLLAEGDHVMGAIRPGSRNEEKLNRPGLKGLQRLYLDFANPPERLPEADAWIHFAWDGEGSAGRSDPAIQRENLVNGKRACALAEKMGVTRFLFAGSQAEYGTGSHADPRPVSEYGKAKLAFGSWGRDWAEGLGSAGTEGVQGAAAANDKDGKIEFLHLRIFSVYGQGDHAGSLVNGLVQAACRKEEMALGPCTQQWNYLEVRDLAGAIRLLVHSREAVTGIYDLAGGTTRPLKEYVKDIYSLAWDRAEEIRRENGRETCRETSQKTGQELQPDCSSETNRGSLGAAEAASMLHFGIRGNNAEGAVDMAPDTERLRALGFREEIPLEQGIRELTTAWMRANGGMDEI